MRRTMLLAAMLALTVLAMGAPAAMADDDLRDDRFEDCFFLDGVLICEEDFDRDFFDGERFDFDFDGELDQDVEQDAESGDIDQSFDVSQTGDNSSQCVGTQGVSNTGNAQNVIDLTQLDGETDDFEFDEVDSSIEVSPESSTTCDQQVNQAASATG
jgi:hypothetical protein